MTLEVSSQLTNGATSALPAAVCPLCGGNSSRRSRLGQIFYAEREFHYLECQSCKSLYCHPMPDDEILARMYGPNYAGDVSADASVADPKEPGEVVRWLRAHEPGTFLDFGCGEGRLLSEAHQLGWKAIGIEYDDEVIQAAADRTGADVFSVSESGRIPSESIDVLHLGDVIEHLTVLAEQMPSILRFLKPGGILLAQGPLEANVNLFIYTVRLSRSLRKSRCTEMAPYHVILATAKGQRRFFQRFGLQESKYIVREVSWPAPSVICAADVVRPRVAALFLVRRVSPWSSALRPDQWGNGYFYAGLKPS